MSLSERVPDPKCNPQARDCVRQYAQGFAYAGVNYIGKEGVPHGFNQVQFFHKDDILIHPSKYHLYYRCLDESLKILTYPIYNLF